ncbi:RNA polymerase sigma factor [uncultured Polaribacter sp.]|uniref:RNA polymerase sigma factor n=1 Tax=uncultured Polaribacter sp. TaxID=174711 RepID=UPI002615E1C1|nr:RNA polymerase sigma-70 factor [uncultured Polaribacter sp.]
MNFKNTYFLTNRLKEGDKKAYAFLIDNYHHKLCVYANSLINNHTQSEDIVQNVFVNLWVKRAKLDPKQSIKSFLYKSVYNEFIDQYRKTQSVMKIEKMYIDYINSIVLDEDKEDTQKLIKQVKIIIQNLPPKCKHVFELSKKEGLTNIEISEHLNVTVKAVEAQITRAFSIIRKKLKGKTDLILFLLFDVKNELKLTLFKHQK